MARPYFPMLPTVCSVEPNGNLHEIFSNDFYTKCLVQDLPHLKKTKKQFITDILMIAYLQSTLNNME
jgi:hypothetical protein